MHNNCEYTTEFVKGFYIRGMTTMENGVYSRTVQGLANYEGKSQKENLNAIDVFFREYHLFKKRK